MTSPHPGEGIPPETAEALNRYADLGLIISWRYVVGRGIVVIDGAMHELTYRSWADVGRLTSLLEGVECAIRTGKVKIGGDEGGDRG